jgi:outer membrane lipoprotein SlyB
MQALTRMLAAALAISVLLLSGCASVAETQPIGGRGVVQSIQETQRTSTSANVVGTVGGAVAGGLLGSMIGGGTGQTIATTVGAMGGAMAGSSVAGKAGAETVWVVNIRFDDGIDRAVTVSQRPNYRPGDKVHVENGEVFPLPAK